MEGREGGGREGKRDWLEYDCVLGDAYVRGVGVLCCVRMQVLCIVYLAEVQQSDGVGEVYVTIRLC